MTYRETLDYLYSRLPMFQRLGPKAFKQNLDTTYQLCDHLGNPQENFPSIHITGTHGKGSVAHFLSSILQEAGYNVGLYTSPHLLDFRERIRLNGRKIPESEVIEFVEQHKEAFEHIDPSFFEMTAGLAFDYFDRQQPDVAIFEVGMGGRLDSTNLVNSILSIITNIGLEHAQYLGNTKKKIAREKAGIIKPRTPVVVGDVPDHIRTVFQEKAQEEEAPIFWASDQYKTPVTDSDFDHLRVDIKHQGKTKLSEVLLRSAGLYEQENLPLLFQSLDVLQQDRWQIPETAIREGLKEIKNNTGFRGRWEVLQSSPPVICDCAHHPDSLEKVTRQIHSSSPQNLHIVMGIVKDKNPEELLEVMPSSATYYFCTPDVPRGYSAQKLYRLGNQLSLEGEHYPTVKEAYVTALGAIQPNDLVLITGSNFTVADVLVTQHTRSLSHP